MRALISCACAATSMRVRPSARKRRKPGERCSASTNCHHDCFSHCPKRRSSQLVSSTSSRSTKKAWSSGEIPSPVQTVNMNFVTAAKSSSEAGACAAVMSSLAPFSRASIIRSAATSSSKTWWPGRGPGMRFIVSGRWR